MPGLQCWRSNLDSFNVYEKCLWKSAFGLFGWVSLLQSPSWLQIQRIMSRDHGAPVKGECVILWKLGDTVFSGNIHITPCSLKLVARTYSLPDQTFQKIRAPKDSSIYVSGLRKIRGLSDFAPQNCEMFCQVGTMLILSIITDILKQCPLKLILLLCIKKYIDDDW